ncbi:MAG: ferric iron uptake transcriptional regulator [Gammaproteobacteria bacterium]|nr:ferric iron uptake transcriptional regulator [Gammaproteobacteria bacterium]
MAIGFHLLILSTAVGFVYACGVESADLKRAGLKITLPRIKVLEVLDGAEPHHLSAEDVYKQLSDAGEAVALATVYRVLTQFEAAGIVDRHNFDDGRAVFELSSESHHDHMVDVDTGEVIEFVNSRIENLQQRLVEERGYELVDHQLVLYVKKRK